MVQDAPLDPVWPGGPGPVRVDERRPVVEVQQPGRVETCRTPEIPGRLADTNIIDIEQHEITGWRAAQLAQMEVAVDEGGPTLLGPRAKQSQS